MGGRRSSRRRRRRRAAAEAGSSGDPDNSPAKIPSSSGESADQQTPPLPQQPKEEAPPTRRPPEDTRALRRWLLGLIRGYYLDAISRLPTASLRTTLARTLLVGGHCYGPLHPVHNIIANSVWYAAAFPLRHSDRIEVCVLSTQGTDRAVRRSLDGLVACLRHLCPFLSPDDALWQLSRARADLRVAVASARRASVRHAAPSLLRAAEPEEVKAAFQVAAQTARHPRPAALALFASSVLPSVERDVFRLLVSKRAALSSLDIDHLSSLLLPYPLPIELSYRPPPDPSPFASQVIAERRRCVARWYGCLLELADAALCKFASQTGLQYELHTIYGENIVDDDNDDEYFHINFMAQPKEDPSSGSVAVPGHRLIFFAEAPRPRDDFREEDITLCCLVKPSPGDIDNCLACLTGQYKIDHPAVQPVLHTHVLHIGGQCYELDKINYEWNFPAALSMDFMFFDSDRDNDLVEYLHNQFARIRPLRGGDKDVGAAVKAFCRRFI